MIGHPGWMRTDVGVRSEPKGVARAIVELALSPGALNGKMIDLIWAGNSPEPRHRLRKAGTLGSADSL